MSEEIIGPSSLDKLAGQVKGNPLTIRDTEHYSGLERSMWGHFYAERLMYVRGQQAVLKAASVPGDDCNQRLARKALVSDYEAMITIGKEKEAADAIDHPERFESAVKAHLKTTQ